MVFITTQHLDLLLSMIGFTAGMAVLVSSHVNTQSIRHAFPILFGMVAWLLVFLLAVSALTETPLPFTGTPVDVHAIWGYVVYKVLFMVVWFDYLRKTAISCRRKRG